MTELSEVLARLGLSQYLGRLIDEGFDRWETVLDITEQDLAVLDFKLGHRRILQREIASARGIPPNQALVTTTQIPVEDSYDPDEISSQKVYKSDNPKANTTGKRKYRRHPKPDEHAPEKPPSAYVMFANRVRDEVRGQNLSFTDIAKLVGEKWKMLDPEYKEEFEIEASIAKEKYQAELAEYKKTDKCREYIQYLSEFKQKNAKEESNEFHRKKPKLEGIPGNGNTPSSTISSGNITSTIVAKPGTTLPTDRMGSISSVTTTSTPSSFPSPSALSPSTPLPLTNQPGTKHPPPSSPISSPSVTRYRDAIVKSTQEQQESLLSQTAHDMEPMSLPRMHPTTVQTPHIQQTLSYSRHQPPPPPSIPSPFLRPTASAGTAMQRPPLRTEDSVSSSGSSSGPLATPLDDGGRENIRALHRALPLPTPTAQASTGIGYFDHRPHHSGSHPSSRHHTYPVLPGPAQLVHPSVYPYPTPSVNTPQTSSSSLTLMTPPTLSSGSSQAPTSSLPPSS